MSRARLFARWALAEEAYARLLADQLIGGAHGDGFQMLWEALAEVDVERLGTVYRWAHEEAPRRLADLRLSDLAVLGQLEAMAPLRMGEGRTRHAIRDEVLERVDELVASEALGLEAEVGLDEPDGPVFGPAERFGALVGAVGARDPERAWRMMRVATPAERRTLSRDHLAPFLGAAEEERRAAALRMLAEVGVGARQGGEDGDGGRGR